jgi:hypothetical protein
MALVYTWKILETNYDVSTGFIVTAHWSCTAIDGAYTASIYSTCTWELGVPTVAYDEVTHQDVLDWCWTANVDKDAIESALAQNIDLQKNPVIVGGLPWGYLETEE